MKWFYIGFMVLLFVIIQIICIIANFPFVLAVINTGLMALAAKKIWKYHEEIKKLKKVEK